MPPPPQSPPAKQTIHQGYLQAIRWRVVGPVPGPSLARAAAGRVGRRLWQQPCSPQKLFRLVGWLFFFWFLCGSKHMARPASPPHEHGPLPRFDTFWPRPFFLFIYPFLALLRKSRSWLAITPCADGYRCLIATEGLSFLPFRLVHYRRVRFAVVIVLRLN